MVHLFLIFFRSLHTIFQAGCIILHSHKNEQGSNSSPSWLTLIIINYFIITILMGVKWCLIVVLICVYQWWQIESFSSKARIPTLDLLVNIFLEVLARAIRQERRVKDIQIRKEEVTLLFADDMIFVESPKDLANKTTTPPGTHKHIQYSGSRYNQLAKVSPIFID